MKLTFLCTLHVLSRVDLFKTLAPQCTTLHCGTTLHLKLYCCVFLHNSVEKLTTE